MSFEEYTDDEMKRWLRLRAIEWGDFPAYLSQPIVPVLFIFYPSYFVVFGVVVLGLLWSLVRYSFVSVGLSRGACLTVVLLTWPAAIGSSIYLFIHHRPLVAVAALVWPLVATFTSILPAKVGIIELALAERVEFASPDAEL